MYGIIYLLPTPILVQKGGANMEGLVSFYLSIMASVVAYYICKWLDEEE